MPKKTTKTNNGVNLGIEAELWQDADKLRGHRGSAKETFRVCKAGEAAGWVMPAENSNDKVRAKDMEEIVE